MLDQDPLAGQGEQGAPHFVLFLYLSPFPQDSWFLEAPLECPTWPILPHQCRQRDAPTRVGSNLGEIHSLPHELCP